MQVSEDLWATEQYEVLVDFVHHLAYYRILSQAYSESRIKSEFWTLTINAHIQRAIIYWCMVFGADSSELHWKRVVVGKDTQHSFRKHLLTTLDFTDPQWKAFWIGMTDFRNKYAAHRCSPSPSAPLMDKALEAAVTYDAWVRQRIDAVFVEPSLQKRYDRLMRTSSEPLRKLVNLGPTLEQEYEGHLPPCQ